MIEKLDLLKNKDFGKKEVPGYLIIDNILKHLREFNLKNVLNLEIYKFLPNKYYHQLLKVFIKEELERNEEIMKKTFKKKEDLRDQLNKLLQVYT